MLRRREAEMLSPPIASMTQAHIHDDAGALRGSPPNIAQKVSRKPEGNGTGRVISHRQYATGRGFDEGRRDHPALYVFAEARMKLVAESNGVGFARGVHGRAADRHLAAASDASFVLRRRSVGCRGQPSGRRRISYMILVVLSHRGAAGAAMRISGGVGSMRADAADDGGSADPMGSSGADRVRLINGNITGIRRSLLDEMEKAL